MEIRKIFGAIFGVALSSSKKDNGQPISSTQLDSVNKTEKSNTNSKQVKNPAEAIAKYEMNCLKRGSMIISSVDIDRTKQKSINEIERDLKQIANIIGIEEVIWTKNVNIAELLHQIDKYNEKDHSKDACFILALVVHEKNKNFVEEKGLQKIFHKLASINLPKEAPKLIFIENCRGGDYESEECSIIDDIFTVNLNDSLIAYSCIKTQSMNTKATYSSTFIENLAKELKINGSKTETHKILTKVNNTMSKEKTKAGVLKQFVSFRSCLTKELYLI